jgi:hypothetical protein
MVDHTGSAKTMTPAEWAELATVTLVVAWILFTVASSIVRSGSLTALDYLLT